MSTRSRHYLAALFGAVAFVSLLKPAPVPAPKPAPASSITLTGKFVGSTAADDACLLAALCDELARNIEFDGTKDQPRLKTGTQMDELRIAAREGRTRGVSIGDRQPKVRAAIEGYLESSLGIGGGPVSAEQRAKWVDAFFEISRAASRAAGK